jgi:hypothetical protein
MRLIRTFSRYWKPEEKSMRGHIILGLAVIVACVPALAGCGTTPGDRGLSGGLLGAGTGAAIGAIAGSAGEGALIGGLGGLAIGALTSPDVINLGEPAWHRTASTSRRSRVARNDCTTRETSTARITTCAKTR